MYISIDIHIHIIYIYICICIYLYMCIYVNIQVYSRATEEADGAEGARGPNDAHGVGPEQCSQAHQVGQREEEHYEVDPVPPERGRDRI